MLPQNDFANKAGPPALMVDAMLGRLARWLRLLGYDATYWRTGSDDALMREAQALGRTIVTRDRQLAGRRGIAAIYIKGETLDEQISEMRAVLSRWAAPEPFSRCPECNGRLQDITKEEAQPLVPPYVWHTQNRFRRCPICGRVYWKGTHYPGMQARLEE